jgi:FKBP-type peptidyl-prolyl cis-trans isomerase
VNKNPIITLAPGFMLLLSISPALLAETPAADEAVELKDAGSQLNYSIGYQIGSDFRRQGVEISSEMLIRGIEDAASGAEPLLQPAEMRTTLSQLQQRVSAQDQQTQPTVAAAQPATAETFLAGNAGQEGVVTLPSGLQYKVLAEGEGATPGATDSVTVHYRGTLVDGTEFDSSYSRNRPATFAVNRVIAGWTEALQLMQEGDKWQLFIPPALAYGERGAGKRIPPNSALIFEVELLSVN